MTRLLKKAFEEAAKLPPEEQDRLAAHVLEALSDEAGWLRAFEASADVLADLADEALAEHASGSTKPLDPDEL